MITCVPVRGYFEENCYFYIDEATMHGFVIDPGAQGTALLELISSQGWIIEKILLTHGHFDHLGAVDDLRDNLGIEVYAHENADTYLLDPQMNLSAQCGPAITVNNACKLKDKDRVMLKANPSFSLQVLHTPGHTRDSVTFYSAQEGVAFVGDTIFKGSIGNPGYPGGNFEQLQQSIAQVLFRLPKTTVLLSGHSEKTTVEEEIERYF